MKKRRNFISSYRHLAHQIFLQVVVTDKAKQRLRTFLRSGFPQNRALGHKGSQKKKQRCLDKLNPRCCPDPSESSKKPLPFGWATMPSHGDLPREETLASCVSGATGNSFVLLVLDTLPAQEKCGGAGSNHDVPNSATGPAILSGTWTGQHPSSAFCTRRHSHRIFCVIRLAPVQSTPHQVDSRR